MKLKVLASVLGFFILNTSYGSSSNYVSITVDKMDYVRPDNNKGDAGNLVFPKVKMSWNDMDVVLENKSSFLDAMIKLRPSKVKFNTSSGGVKINLPLVSDSLFFMIQEMKLNDSKFSLNQDNFNFNGKAFEISDGVSTLVLDKFNISCIAPNGVDMTSLDGLIYGCLADLIVNGQKKEDLAGAQIDYYDDSNQDDQLFLTSRLKSLKLKNNTFKLDLNKANLKVSEYEVNLGNSDVSCSKDEELTSLEVDQLKNGCINSVNIHAPDVRVKNIETQRETHISLDSLKTTEDQLKAVLRGIGLVKNGTSTKAKNIDISCFREKNSEFYDLNKTIGGCVENAKIDIPEVVWVGTSKKEDSGWFAQLFADEQKAETAFIKNIDVTIKDNKMSFYAIFDFPKFPKFELDFEAYIAHDSENRTVSLEIMDAKLMKIFRKYVVNILLKVLAAKTDELQMSDNVLIYKF